MSSKRWLERRLNDPYVAAARDRGLRSRAAFKLVEIDDKARFLKPGAVVVDLGRRPADGRRSPPNGSGPARTGTRHRARPDGDGSAARRHGASARFPGARGGRGAAPGTRWRKGGCGDLGHGGTGERPPQTDHLKVMALADAALDFARQVLKPGGTFLCKVLRGGTERSCSRA